MGGGKRYPYPKHVWSPAGGWWCVPRSWKRNTALLLIASAALCVPVVYLDLKLQRRYVKIDNPGISQRYAFTPYAGLYEKTKDR